jgi:D-alanine--D-alanine ligase
MSSENDGVLILYNLPRSLTGFDALHAESDAGVIVEVAAVRAALDRLGIPCRAKGMRRLDELTGILAAAPESVVFNLVESLESGVDDLNLVPGLCRAMGKGVTGSDTPALTLSLDKWQTKAVLRAHGLPVPQDELVPVGQSFDGANLGHGPFIVKPIKADASEGLTALRGRAGLEDAIRHVHEHLKQAALVERFFGSREINVSLLERAGNTEILPLAEIDFTGFGSERLPVVDYRAKWLTDSFEYQNTRRVVPAPLDAAVAERIRGMAVQVWQAVGCQDYARVDLRLNASGEVAILEVNTNPDVAPDGGFAAALAAGGVPYEAFVQSTVENAARRAGVTVRCPHSLAAAPTPAVTVGPLGIGLRRTLPDDREAILNILRDTGFFRPDEIAIGTEVLDEALVHGAAGHYQSYTALLDEQAVGWVCFGPTPCTLGTFDIYWIAVTPKAQGRGIGRALMEHAERLMAERGGRLAIIETSGRVVYEPTRGFYLKLGYREEACLPDFYAPGDAKAVYVKAL